MTVGVDEVVLGDCLEVMREIPTASVDAVVTDPPYGTSEADKAKNSGIYAIGWKSFGESWDDELPLEWIQEASRILTPGGALVAWTDTKRTETVWKACESASLRPLQLVFWSKTNAPTNPRKNFMSSVEAAVFARKPGKVRYWAGRGSTPNVYRCAKVAGAHKCHPTQKPLELMAWLVRLLCPPKGIVLDCFSGSGTTAVACIQEGRHFIGIERDPTYHAIARTRVAEAQAAQQARLFADADADGNGEALRRGA